MSIPDQWLLDNGFSKTKRWWVRAGDPDIVYSGGGAYLEDDHDSVCLSESASIEFMEALVKLMDMKR